MRYNVVAICLDTFRWDLLHHRAPWPVALPHLDRLRAESLEFMQAYGDGQPTIPIRRAYFTGERSFPWRFDYDTEGLWPTGRGWHKIPPGQRTLAEVLLDEGYQTGLISDTYHMFKPTMNFTRGFLSYEFLRGYESDNFRSGRLARSALAPYVRDPDPAQHPVLAQYALNIRGRAREEDWLTAQVFRRAGEWIADHRESEPFMLWVDSFGPHEPWDPPREYVDRRYGSYSGIEFIYPYGMQTGDLSPAEADRVRHLYLGYLTFVDHWMGHLWERIQQEGLEERTIVVLLNDHGTELLDHGRFSKHPSHLFKHNTQLIWSIRHPEYPTRREISAFVQSHDLFPTLLRMLDIEHGPVAGQVMWPEPAEPLRPWIVTGWGNYASVRDERWSYMVNFEDPGAEGCLYDGACDPEESFDVAAANPAIVAQMRERLAEFFGAPLPVQLNDGVRPSVAPIRRYLRSAVAQDQADAGFV